MGIAYESIILFAVLFFFGYAYSSLTQFKGQPGSGYLGLGLQIWIFSVLALYFGFFWSAGRRSLPMKTIALAIVDGAGAPLSVARALARYCAVLVCLLAPLALAKWVHPALAALLVAPFATTLIDRDRRAVYDILCGTRLVYTGH
jgi:uncharacterized RDD family membrane protein YckC